ncbi:MAG: signal peptidase II [Solirubrobacteraceae bacterium]
MVVVGLDQLTKQVIVANIAPGQIVKVLPGLELVHWRNSGVAFSVLAGGGAIVFGLAALALAVLIMYLSIRPERPWLWLPTGLLIGGAIGNLIDRFAGGAVTDFIKLPLWPAFNVADMSITFGVILLVLLLDRGRGDAA